MPETTTIEVHSIAIHHAIPGDITLVHLEQVKCYCLSIGPVDIYLNSISELLAISDRILTLAGRAVS